MWTDCTVVEG